jgi:hypothetical protein
MKILASVGTSLSTIFFSAKGFNSQAEAKEHIRIPSTAKKSNVLIIIFLFRFVFIFRLFH